MAKGHRSQIKRERNENQKDTRPSAKLSYARVSAKTSPTMEEVLFFEGSIT